MPKGRREPLGSRAGLFHRERIFMIADGIEIDDVDFATVRRKRIFFDDLRSVAIHRTRKSWRAFLALLPGVGFLIPAMFAPVDDQIVLLVLAAPFLLISAGAIALGRDLVTVRGPRTRGVMEFVVRKGKARAVFERIAAEARRAQRVPPPALQRREREEPPPTVVI